MLVHFILLWHFRTIHLKRFYVFFTIIKIIANIKYSNKRFMFNICTSCKYRFTTTVVFLLLFSLTTVVPRVSETRYEIWPLSKKSLIFVKPHVICKSLTSNYQTKIVDSLKKKKTTHEISFLFFIFICIVDRSYSRIILSWKIYLTEASTTIFFNIFRIYFIFRTRFRALETYNSDPSTFIRLGFMLSDQPTADRGILKTRNDKKKKKSLDYFHIDNRR